MTAREVFIVGAARTPIGSFQGVFAGVSAVELGATAIRGALERARVAPADVDETYMGNVLSAGIGQAPARQAAKAAGILDRTPATTVSKVCGSGLMSVILGTKAILLEDAGIVLAGGMENMTASPYLLPKARAGYRMGHGQLVDSMIHDGLWDPYGDFHMGMAGELCAREEKISREDQDRFAAESYRRALIAQEQGRFAEEIVAVAIHSRDGETRIVEDEEPKRGQLEKMAKLKPAFDKAGTITAANASKINDGAAAVVLASAQAVKDKGLKPIARVVAYGGHAQAPEWFTTAPVGAMEAVLKRAELKNSDIDLFEINEAFSVVTLACQRRAGLDPAKINVRGGAVALGHPIGASGARILTTLLFAMRERKANRGLATLCIGGGEAVAVVVEAV